MASGGKQKQVVNQTVVAKPEVPDFIQTPYKDYSGKVNSLLASDPDPSTFTTPANANQTRAFSMAGTAPNAAIEEGIGGTRGLTGYTPGLLRDTNLDPYMDPYEDEVVDRSLTDLDRFRQKAIVGGQAGATMSGSYGGSRHGVADAETNRGYIDQAGLLSSTLRSAGFDKARDAAKFDINTGLSGADFRLKANQQLTNMGLAGDANLRAQIEQLSQLGAEERQIAMQNNPEMAKLARLASIGGLLGAIPTNTFTGGTTQTNGTTTGSYSPGLLDWVNAGANVVGAFSGGKG